MEGVVDIKIFDREDVVFEGKVSSDVEPHELLHMRCFMERNLKGFCIKGTNETLTSFRGLQHVDLAAGYGWFKFNEFSGILFVGVDGVLRKSNIAPSCECVMMSVWRLSHHNSSRVFCDTLEVLDINECKLTEIPKGIGKMNKLKKLRMFGLKCLRTIPEEIGQLETLTELWIEDCVIKSLPNTVGGMKQVERMKLMYLYELNSIPEQIGELRCLKELVIYSCSIECLPKSTRELKFLESIDLFNLWNLHLYPEDVVVFSKLKELCIKACEKLFKRRDTLKALLDMLKTSVNLRSIALNLEQQEGREMIVSALRENGSIVEGSGNVVSGLPLIFRRNKLNHDRAIESVVCVLALKRWRHAMCKVPKEIVEMISRMLWITRCDVKAWREMTVQRLRLEQ